MIVSAGATPAYRTRQRIEHERLIAHTGSTTVPLAVLRLPLSPSAFRLYVLFGSLIGDGDTCQISRETLAETLPLSVRQNINHRTGEVPAPCRGPRLLRTRIDLHAAAGADRCLSGKLALHNRRCGRGLNPPVSSRDPELLTC